MKYAHLILIASTAVLVSACASKHAKNEAPDSAPTAKPAPAKDSGKTATAPAPEGAIVGKPAPGSKFSKLKIGMTMKQAQSLIGPPTNQWQRPTGKAHIPFYFGPDRWVLECAYKGEGILTFNYGEDQLLTHMEVNKAQ